MQKRLENKNIIVTGGSRGIGAGIAKVLAQHGAQIGFTYSTNEEAAKKTLTDLPGENHFCVQMNLADENSINQAFNQVSEHFPVIHGIVNNAGITKDQLLLRMKPEDFDSVIQTNLRGTFLCTKHAVKLILKAKIPGSVVNITSVIGQMGNAGQSNYAASKAGIEAFTKSVSQEVANRGIRLNCVAPGYIATEMTAILTEEQKNKMLQQIPSQSIGTTEDVAYACVYLLSDESKYITGHTLSVNGGLYMK